MADTQPKLLIDGTEYPLPQLGDMNMGEARILKRYTNKSIEELEAMPATDPDLVAAVCHVVLLRETEGASSFAEIEQRVNAIKLAELDIRRGDDVAEGDARPPAPTSADATSSDAPTSGPPSAEPSEGLQGKTRPPIGAPV